MRASLVNSKLLLLFCFIASSIVSASEYSLSQTVNLRAYFADNFTLSTINEDERYGGTGSLNLDLSKATETSELNGGIFLAINNYNIKSYNTSDQRGNFDYTKKTESGSWGFGGVYDRDSISEFEKADQNLGQQDRISSQVLSQSLRANWNQQINEKNLFALSASATDVAYESVFRNDYRYGQSSLLWQHFLTDRIRLQANIAYSLFDSDSTNSLSVSPLFDDAIAAGDLSENDAIFLIEACRSGFNLIDQVNGGALTPWRCFEELERDNLQSTVKLQVGIYYVWTDYVTLDLLYGESSVKTELEQSYIDLPSLDGSEGPRTKSEIGKDDGGVYQASISYSGERFQSSFNASRNESVNSNSVLSLNTNVGLDVRLRVNEYHSINGGVAWYRQENSGFSGAEFFDKDIATFTLIYQYNVSENWTLRSTYKFKDLDQAQQLLHASGNEVSFNVRWNPAKYRWSR
jgi:hypothetical protein